MPKVIGGIGARLVKLWQSLDAASKATDHLEGGMSLQDVRNTISEDKILDLEERFDRLLAHYGLEYLIDTNGCGWLRTVPLLEEIKREIEALKSKVIWEDKGPSQEQVQAMVDVWRAWSSETPGLRPSVNDLMRKAYLATKA